VEEADGRRILIDTPPELRLQLLAAEIESVDAVLYTHDHADHVHGIDDLRAISVRRGILPLYGPVDTIERIRHRFSYIFDPQVVPPKGTSKPELRPAPLEPGNSVTIVGMDVLPLALDHGSETVFGYRIGPVGYVTDAKSLPGEAVAELRGVRVLVVNALFQFPHPTHLSIPEAVEVAQAVGAERTFLTHLTHKYGHAELSETLPDGVEPAYDGLTVTF
jgi:phosphoribosyl 1,2-cyclic phosphate phosphodiesterase